MFYKKLFLRYLIVMLSVVVLVPETLSQVSGSNVEAMYFEARSHIASGRWNRSKALCNQILSINKDYSDASILLARIYGWERKYDSAHIVLDPIIAADPKNYDARMLQIDLLLWEQKCEQARQILQLAVDDYPNDPTLIDKQKKLAQCSTASSIPTVNFTYKNGVFVDYLFDTFDKDYIARRNMLTAGYLRRASWGVGIARANFGQDVQAGHVYGDDLSVQGEFDLYPKLTSSSYLYINYGYADGTFFPKHRAGLEYFQALPAKFEVSLGGRYLQFDEDIWIVTASVSKYFSNYMLAFRPYITLTGNDYKSAYMLSGRRYFKKPESFIFAYALAGNSPDQTGTLLNQYGKFRAYKGSLGIQYLLGKRIIGKIAGAYSYEEYLKDTWRNRWEVNAGLMYNF